MDNIAQLINILKELEADFVSQNHGKAFQGIIMTLAQTFPARGNDFQELLPKSANATRVIKNPVTIKSLGGSGVPGHSSTCATCGKNSNVVVPQNKYVSSGVLKLSKKVEEIAQEVFDQPYDEPNPEIWTMTSQPLEGEGVSPVHFENPEKILTGEPVIESNDWVAVLQEVKDIPAAKQLYKAITGKGYPPRWPQDLDQIAKAIWEARQNIEI